MRLVRYLVDDSREPRVGLRRGSEVRDLPIADMAALLRFDVGALDELLTRAGPSTDVSSVRLLSPIDGRTEVWAAGVTYQRSQEARIQESAQQSVYEMVYDAERPELFFKSAAWRVVTNGDPVGIRADSSWNVPEPELAVVVNRHAEIVGYLVCNDMSSRSLEGENPLYLPQAKIYAGACALSTEVALARTTDVRDAEITMTISRRGQAVWRGDTRTSRMHRPVADLITFAFRAENFPDGLVLSTGTGIVPPNEFTLEVGDTITIEIAGVGTLRNTVTCGRASFDGGSTRAARAGAPSTW